MIRNFIGLTMSSFIFLGTAVAFAENHNPCVIEEGKQYIESDDPSIVFSGKSSNRRVTVEVKAGSVDVTGYRVSPNQQKDKTVPINPDSPMTVDFSKIQALWISPRGVTSIYRYKICLF